MYELIYYNALEEQYTEPLTFSTMEKAQARAQYIQVHGLTWLRKKPELYLFPYEHMEIKKVFIQPILKLFFKHWQILTVVYLYIHMVVKNYIVSPRCKKSIVET